MERTALMEEEERGEKLRTAGRTADRARFGKQTPGFIQLAWLSSYISFDWLHPGNLGPRTRSRMTVRQIKRSKSGSITGLSFSIRCIKPTEIVELDLNSKNAWELDTDGWREILWNVCAASYQICPNLLVNITLQRCSRYWAVAFQMKAVSRTCHHTLQTYTWYIKGLRFSIRRVDTTWLNVYARRFLIGSISAEERRHLLRTGLPGV